jgi:hypothetical protein
MEHREHRNPLPFQFRANDVVKHIINVDSRFRDTPRKSSPSDFYFSLFSPVKNVLRVRITSVEFSNNYLFFTEKRKTISFNVRLHDGDSFLVMIPDGNYNADEMEFAINESLQSNSGTAWLSVVFNETEGSFVFTGGTVPFTITTAVADKSWNRPFDYGLGYYLGYSYGVHASTTDPSGNQEVVSDQCANLAGDNYVFLRVNDYACVRQTIRTYPAAGATHEYETNDFTALAKIVLREPKNNMAFDDYAGQHAKEVVFPAPTDLSRFRIQVLDPYGNIIDLCSAQWSFSIEVLEIKNLSLYNAIRDSISFQYA